jgi:phosphoglycolate phosphatase
MHQNGRFPRIILFDIDGTLIRAARRGEYRKLIQSKLLELFGTYGRIAQVDFGGKTDLAIYREALECEGITLKDIIDRTDEIEIGMSDVLAHMSRSGDVFHLCHGVRELLDALAEDQRFVPSLLTGNMEKLAEAKLRLAGIWQYFQGRGAFGGDAEDRDHLPEIAAKRMSEYLGQDLTADRFVIVGDTPRDISCARHFGSSVVAVASGQHTLSQLEAHSPDGLLMNLGDPEAVAELLARI